MSKGFRHSKRSSGAGRGSKLTQNDIFVSIMSDGVMKKSTQPLSFKEYDREIGMTMFILKHTKADTKTLARRDGVRFQGDSLLSLALRTADEGIIKQVLEYDSDIDRRKPTSNRNPSAEYASRVAMLWIDRGHRPKEDPACTPLQLGVVTEYDPRKTTTAKLKLYPAKICSIQEHAVHHH